MEASNAAATTVGGSHNPIYIDGSCSRNPISIGGGASHNPIYIDGGGSHIPITIDGGGGSHNPIYISDEDDERRPFDGFYNPDDDVEVQEVILLSSRAAIAPSAFGSASGADAGVSNALHPPDRKGKCKLSSEDLPNNSKKKRSRRLQFECSICFDKVEATEEFIVTHCYHAFCTTCIGRYVAAKVSDNVAIIGCPDPECNYGSVEIDRCRGIIPSELFDRWSVALCENIIGADKFYCPFKDCSALLINDGALVITDTECPHCRRLFCASCRVPWHHGMKCSEFKMLGDDEKGQDDLALRNLANKNKWQRCPMCKMYVERIAGCAFMMCRCRHCFCYNCGSAMTTGNHNCSRCIGKR